MGGGGLRSARDARFSQTDVTRDLLSGRAAEAGPPPVVCFIKLSAMEPLFYRGYGNLLVI